MIAGILGIGEAAGVGEGEGEGDIIGASIGDSGVINVGHRWLCVISHWAGGIHGRRVSGRCGSVVDGGRRTCGINAAIAEEGTNAKSFEQIAAIVVECLRGKKNGLS